MRESAWTKLLALLNKAEPVPLVCFSSLALKQCQHGLHDGLQISAGDVAEIAYAILCSATSLLSEMAIEDASQAGHWFVGGAVFADGHPGFDPLNQLLIEYDREEAQCRRENWEKYASDHEQLLQYGVSLHVNMFCALRMMLTVERLVWTPMLFLPSSRIM